METLNENEYSELCLNQSVISEVNQIIQKLHEEWNKIQMSFEEQERRKDIVNKTVIDLCAKLLKDEKDMISRIQEQISNNKEELLLLSKLLNIDVDESYKNIPLIKQDHYLSNKISELSALIKERQESLQELLDEDQKISAILGESPCSVEKKKYPHEDDLQQIRNHIKRMKEEKVERLETYKTLRKDIIEFGEQLEKSFNNTLLLDIVCDSPEQDTPTLTEAFMQDIKKLHSDLEFEMKELESKSLELREKVFSLWSLLGVPTEVKAAFLESIPSHTVSSISKLYKELDRLKELRKQNLSRLVKKLRTDLWQWWGKCYVGEEQKEKFNQMETVQSTEANEECLEAYENEVNRWKNYYGAHTAILKYVDHFLAVFDRMRQLEEKSKDPKRLFNTRGGALLQEERERKSVRAQLPNIQSRLEELGLEFEQQNGYPFRIDGKPVAEYLNHVWSFHTIQREQEKTKMRTRKGSDLPPTKRSVLKTPTTPALQRKRPLESDVGAVGSSCSKRKVTQSTFLKSPMPPRFLKAPSSETKAKPLIAHNQIKPSSCDDTFVQMSYNKFKVNFLRDLDRHEAFNSTIKNRPCISPTKARRLKQQLHIDTPRKNQEQNVRSRDGGSPMVGNSKYSPLKSVNGSPHKTGTISPTKKTASPFPGGASGGTFMRRSMSQPMLHKISCKKFLLM